MAGFMANRFWLGAALRISDMTESLGPETVTDWRSTPRSETAPVVRLVTGAPVAKRANQWP